MSLLSHIIIYEIGKNQGENEVQQPTQVKTIEVKKEVCVNTIDKYVVDSWSITTGLMVGALLLGFGIAKALSPKEDRSMGHGGGGHI